MVRSYGLLIALGIASCALGISRSGARASGQETGAPASLFKPVVFDYDAYYRQGDAETASPVGVSATMATHHGAISTTLVEGEYSGVDCGGKCDPLCSSSCNCGSVCASGGLLSGCGCIGGLEGWSIADAVGLDASVWEIGGWTQLGYHDGVTPRATTAGAQRSRSFNDNPNTLNLHQQWFYLGKKADGSNGLDIGGRLDAMYGIDARKAQAFRNPPGSFDEDWLHGVYGWAIPQLYGEVAAGDASVKIGRFLSPLGYETLPAPANFFYSHALTYVGSEPLTMTGVLGSYRGFGDVELFGGWTAGWDTGFDSQRSGSNFVGGAALDLMQDLTLTYMAAYGNFGQRDGGNPDSYAHSIVLQAGLTDNLVYVGQTDLYESSLQSEESVGLNQYLFYSLSGVLELGQRVEWWKLDGQSYYEATSGVNVRLLSNLALRPEYRIDWSPATQLDERTAAVDVVLTY